MVMEKEFSSNNAHKDEIHGVLKYDNHNENENVVYTCSKDQTFKKWDFQEDEASYTIEQNEPFNVQCITGQDRNVSICALGVGNLIVHSLPNLHQQDYKENAHKAEIFNIITLERLDNKFFITRCSEGNLIVWSAYNNPDQFFGIKNIDKEEEVFQMADQEQ